MVDTSGDSWIVHHRDRPKSNKVIGRIWQPRCKSKINYRDRAQEEADRRNYLEAKMNTAPFFYEIIKASRFYKNGAPGTVVLRNGNVSIHLFDKGHRRQCEDFVTRQLAFHDAMEAEKAKEDLQLSFTF